MIVRCTTVYYTVYTLVYTSAVYDSAVYCSVVYYNTVVHYTSVHKCIPVSVNFLQMNCNSLHKGRYRLKTLILSNIASLQHAYNRETTILTCVMLSWYISCLYTLNLV